MKPKELAKARQIKRERDQASFVTTNEWFGARQSKGGAAPDRMQLSGEEKVASTLDDMHSRRRLHHGDVAVRNVLVRFDRQMAYLSDVGLDRTTAHCWWRWR